MPSVTCHTCGLPVQVPAGGRRLCGCGTWLSADEPPLAVPVEIEPDDAPTATAAPAWDLKGARIESDLAAIERLNNGYKKIRKELGKAIVGQDRVIEELLISIFSRGHCLLVGVPGLAKTLMIRTLA